MVLVYLRFQYGFGVCAGMSARFQLNVALHSAFRAVVWQPWIDPAEHLAAAWHGEESELDLLGYHGHYPRV
jgi:hypothetical protein